MAMSHYEIKRTDKFEKDVEEISFWILVTNVEHSENLAETKLSQLESELIALTNKIQIFQSPAKKLRPKVFVNLLCMTGDILQGGLLTITKKPSHLSLFWI